MSHEKQTPHLIDHVPSSEELQTSRDRSQELEDFTITPGAFKALSEGATKSVVELNQEFPYEGQVAVYEPSFKDRESVEGSAPLDDDLNAPARPMSEIREIVRQIEGKA